MTESGSNAVSVALDGVEIAYFTGHRRVDVLKNVNLVVSHTERVGLMGRSGAGKSSLIYAIAGLVRPVAGTIRVAGTDLSTLDDEGAAAVRLMRVGIVYQAFHLIRTLSALENVALPMRMAGLSAEESKTRAAELLNRVGLVTRSSHRPAQLSGGEQQRVAVARAIANGPDVILADEPTGNLDDSSALDVLNLLDEMVAEGRCLILVTHDERIAHRMDRTLFVDDGRLYPDEQRGGD